MNKKLILALLVGGLLLAPFSFPFTPLQAQTALQDVVINQDTIWTLANSPYLINGGYVLVQTGATLTIEPGVVVKFYTNTGMTVFGNVVAKGTKALPIVFTSQYDIAYGGNTSPNPAQVPQPGDWATIRVLGASLTMDNAIVSYGGFEEPILIQNISPLSVQNAFAGYPLGTISLSGGTVAITNSTLTQNTIAAQLVTSEATSTLTIKDSDISKNTNAGVISQDDPLNKVDVRSNWWGANSGPYQATKNPNGKGDAIEGNDVLFIPWVTKNNQRPVIIVPGILGSELYNGTDLIWANLGKMFTDIGDQFLTDNLSLDENGNSIKSITVGKGIDEIGKSIFKLDIFAGLIKELGLSGYNLNTSLYLFSYDWRLGLDNAAQALQQKIAEVKTATGSDKVDIVAHSMGGLVTKDYIQQYGKDSIGKLIFVGTPHLGAPKAAKVLLAGDQFNIPWLEAQRMKELARNSLASYELLPNQTYFNVFTGYLKKYNEQQPLDYTQTKDFLISKNLNKGLFDSTETFFAKNLEKIDLSGIDAYNIAGCKTPTQAGYKFTTNQANIAFPYYTSGDETVPLISSNFLFAPADHKYYVKNAKHSELPSVENVSASIVDILHNTAATSYSNISNSPLFCDFKGKEMLWKSPVDVHIYDDKGNHTGPIEHNGIERSVPNVSYDIVGHEKFIFLPTDEGQIYRVVATGKDRGTFDLLLSTNNNGEVISSNVFNDVPVSTSTLVNFNVSDATSDNTIQVDTNGTGTFSTLQANATLTGQQIDDLAPPQTTASLSGTLGNNNWYKSDAILTLNATDDNSGVLETRYSLDNGATFKPYQAPFSITQEGITHLQYFSIDKAGNDEAAHSLDVAVDKTAPEISAQFNLAQKDFVFSATDNLDTAPTLTCTFTDCAAQDSAGNKTMLQFTRKNHEEVFLLSLSAISYNTVQSSLPVNTLLVKLEEEDGKIEEFNQTFAIKNQEILRIKYNPKRKQSTILTLIKGGGISRQVLDGIRILQAATASGLIKANY